MADRVVTIDGVRHAFPADATDAEISAALNAIPAPNAASAPKARTWTDTAVDLLPAAGGAIGGLVGGIGGTVAGVGVGGVPGAVGGAALGGAAGEAGKQIINRLRGAPAPSTPLDAAKAIGTQAAVQGGAELVGAGVGKAASAIAPRIMQSALKPGLKTIAGDMRAGREVPKVVQTLLDEGINVSPGGVSKLQDILGATNDQISTLVKNAPGTIAKTNVISQTIPETAAKFATQVNPEADLGAIDAVVNGFINHPTLGKSDLTVAQAQALKVGTYRVLKQKYGQMGAASVEAEKALARGLKDEVAGAIPEVSQLNAREGNVLEALDAVGKRAALAGNKDPIGFAWAAHNPSTFLAALIDRNAAVKSMLARGMYQGAAVAGHTTPQLIRVAVASLAAGVPMDDSSTNQVSAPGPQTAIGR